MNKFLLTILVLTGSLIVKGQVTTISQTDTGLHWYSGNDALGGQSFTITQAGYITEIRFNTQGAEGSTTFEIRQGQNVSGPLLYSTVINIAAAGWIVVPIPNIPVCEGVYCFTQSGYQWGSLNISDPYPGGGSYYLGNWIPTQDQAFEIDQIINEQPSSPTTFSNYTLCAGQTVPPTVFTVVDESPGTVTVTSVSSNITVIPNTSLTISGSGTSRTLSVSGVLSTPGTTTITITLNDGNCSQNYTFNVTVYAPPPVSAGPDQSICTGGLVTLSGSGAISYIWDNGVTNGVAFSPGVGSVTYTLTGTDGNGCTATDVAIVTVYALPVVNFGAVSAQCIDGTAITLTQGIPAGGIYSGPGVSGGNFDPGSAGPGTHSISYFYTDGNGCINSATQTIQVNNIPAVNFPPLADICENAVPFTLTTATPAGGIYSGTGVTGSSFNPAAAGTGSHSLTYTYTDGVCTNDASTSISVTTPPTVNAGSSVTVCSGDPVTLTATGTAASYTWDGGISDGIAFIPPVGVTTYTVTGTGTNSCQNTSSVNVTAFALPIVNFATVSDLCIDGISYTLTEGTPIGGTYTGTGISGSSFDPLTAGVGTHAALYSYTDGNGCTADATQNITVNDLPVVTFSPLADICLSATAFSVSGGSPAGGTYSGTGISGGIFDPSVAGTGTHTITYTYTDGVTTCTNTATQNITVYDLPVVSANSTAILVCEGTSVILTGSGASTYNWDNGATDGVALFPPAGTTTYTVTGTDLNGCQNTDQIIITTNPLPAIDAGADQVVCEGTSTTLTGSGAVSYVWDNGVIDGAPFLPTAGITTYTVTGTDANGCENTDVVTIDVNALPILVTSPDQFFCEGETVTLTVSGATTYDWNSGAGTGNTFSISPATNTTVQVTGTIAICSNTTTINLTLDDPSQIDAGNDAVVCPGFLTYLDASGGIDYTWNGPGVVNITDANHGFIVDTTAYYYLTAVTAQGCTYKDSVSITANPDPACVIEPLTTFSPNGDAVNEAWKIQGIESFPENQVTILNRWGDIVFEEMNYDNETILWNGTLQNGSEAPAGTYYFIIELTNGPSTTGWIQLLK